MIFFLPARLANGPKDFVPERGLVSQFVVRFVSLLNVPEIVWSGSVHPQFVSHHVFLFVWPRFVQEPEFVSLFPAFLPRICGLMCSRFGPGTLVSGFSPGLSPVCPQFVRSTAAKILPDSAVTLLHSREHFGRGAARLPVFLADCCEEFVWSIVIT